MTRYTDAQRAEAVALAALIGSKQAAKQLSIPRRSVSRWLQQTAEHDPAGPDLGDRSTRDAVGDALWRVVERGAAAMERAIADPDARGSDLARMTDTAFRAYALITGGPTARIDTGPSPADDAADIQWWEQVAGGPLVEDEHRFLRDSIDYTYEWLQEALVLELRAARAERRSPVTIDLRTRATVLPPALLVEGRNGQ